MCCAIGSPDCSLWWVQSVRTPDRHLSALRQLRDVTAIEDALGPHREAGTLPEYPPGRT